MQIEEFKTTSLPFRFSQTLIKHPFITLGVFFAICAFLLPGLMHIHSSYSPRIWFAKDHREIQKLNAFEKRFGSDLRVVIGVYHPQGIFQKERLEIIHKLTEGLWQVPDVMRVESLSNFNDIESKDDDIFINPFIPEEELNAEKVQALKEKAKQDKTITNYFISEDQTYSLIYGILRPSFDQEPDFEVIVGGVEELIRPYQDQNGLKLFVMGDAPASDSFREIAAKDNKLILPFMALVILILLFILYRSLIALILPLFLAAITIGTTYGILGYLNITFNSLLAAIPGILLAICLADAIHVFNTFFYYRSLDHKTKDALQMALTKNFWPTILTSVSTAISFISITITEILPIKDLGVLSAFGTLLAWIFTYLLISSIVTLFAPLLDKKKVSTFFYHHRQDDAAPLKWAVTATTFINQHKGKIIIFFILFVSSSFYISLRNEVNSDPLKYFGPHVPIRQAYDFAGTKIDGLRGVELVIDSGKAEGAKDPDFLKRMDQFSTWLESEPEISQSRSLITVIKEMNKTLHGDNEVYYTIPESQTAVAQLIFLYTMGLPQGMGINNQISLDNRYLRARIVWDINTSKEAEAKVKTILAKAPEFNLNVETGGNVPIYIQMNTQVVKSFFASMVMAILLVSLLIYIVFKDLFISLLSMLPNIIPLVFGAALMAILGKYVDIGTSIVCAVCLGIAVDDTIHFVSSFKNAQARGLSSFDAITQTLSLTGRALIATTVLLVFGFGSFIFADFIPNHNFGVLCSLILSIALFTDLIFLPAMLLFLKEKKQDKVEDEHQSSLKSLTNSP